MKATTKEPVAETVRTETQARFRDLFTAEWIKLWSLRSTAWTLLLSAVAIFGFNCYSAHSDYVNLENFSAAARADFSRHAMFDAFTGVSCMVLMLSVGIIAANVVVSEYGTGLIRATFVAVPARHGVMAAKLAVVTAVSLGYGLVVVGGSFLATQAILDGKDVGLSISDPGVPERLLASVLMAPLTALVATAMGVLVRHSIGTLTTFVGAFMLLPLALSERLYATAVLGHLTPYRAWLRIADIEFGSQPYPWTASGAWTVYAVWAVLAAILTVVVAQRRDH